MRNIAVFGLGFVGLPLSLTYTLYGVKVYGVDINEEYVNRLKHFETHILENYKGKTIQEILRESIEKDLFIPTASHEEAMANVNEVVVTVGIPIVGNTVHTEVFEDAMKTIGRSLKKGDIVLIRSTVPPGTTREVALPILESASGFKCSRDFYLAYSSERIAEGNAFDEFQTMPIAVAGVDEASTKKAKELLKIINKEVIEASSPEVVEISKLIENSSRDVNIGLANELATFTESLGVDTLEVIMIANTHKRVKLLNPGIGVGGHCIPYSSKYLFYKSDRIGVSMPLLHSAREVNDSRPEVIFHLIESNLAHIGKSIKDVTTALLGIAMKDNSSDASESPSLKLTEIIEKNGGKVKWFDPNVNLNLPSRVFSLEEALAGADVAIVPIFQGNVPVNIKQMQKLMKNSPLLFDAKGIIDRKSAVDCGFIYLTI